MSVDANECLIVILGCAFPLRIATLEIERQDLQSLNSLPAIFTLDINIA